jgi:hypothetical protein
MWIRAIFYFGEFGLNVLYSEAGVSFYDLWSVLHNLLI